MRLSRLLRPEDLIERARRSSGLADFGDTPFRDGLTRFLHACNEEARLGLVGHLATRWDIGRFLANLLRLRDEERRAPEILDQPIERPLFITGLPRSGTTFLHQLLAEDPANQVPRIWQLIHPYPEPRDASTDRRRQRVARQLRTFALLAPGFRQMHPVEADSPQECSEINAHVFASLRFDSNYTVPSYRRWLDRAGHVEAYRFHRRFLQHLQYQAGAAGNWVLKCPDHIFALRDIRTVYPDARIVFVHRDPARVLPSVARLTELLRRPFTRHIDRTALGRQECERWCDASRLMIEAGDANPFREPIYHIHHRDLVGDPLGAVEGLYRHFGRALRPEAANRIGQMVEAKPNGGYAGNRSTGQAYGIDPDAVRAGFARYMDRFGVIPESTPAAPRRVPIARPQIAGGHLPASARYRPGSD